MENSYTTCIRTMDWQTTKSAFLVKWHLGRLYRQESKRHSQVTSLNRKKNIEKKKMNKKLHVREGASSELPKK